MNTWSLPLRKIVIAKWLQDIAEQMGETAEYIPNGLDIEAFGMDIPPEDRDGCRVMMLYHEYDWKGSRDGLRALEMVKECQPDLHVTLFGVPSKPSGLPSWIEYFQNPPQRVLRRLYNEAAVFLATSWSEGWGLPASEAMICGAAVVATDIGGHREFAMDVETALLVPPRDPSAMANQVQRLLASPRLRIDLAYRGNRFIQRFTWQRSVDAMERCFFQSVESREAVFDEEMR
ncbi:glycosyltransferase family 4 protein [Kyrpidia spormannii]|nr:glycosyltransferase family 4 protein [Kyrpidia spormannii]